MNVGMQTNVVPNSRCEEAIAVIAKLTHSVQTLSSRVDILCQANGTTESGSRCYHQLSLTAGPGAYRENSGSHV